jgi:UDPglucose 6-dehydrogenase
MRVSVVGAGYAGLVTAACLAEQGHSVTCADLDPAKVDLIARGASPIHEIGLDAMLERWAGKRLFATTDVGQAVASTDLTLIAVGTPSTDDGIDLTALRSASRAIGSALGQEDRYHVVAVKSTVVPGTTDGVVLPELEQASGKRAGPGFGVGVNPEFLTEGQAVADFMSPDRLVLGAIDERTHAALLELYAPFPPTIPRLLTNTRTAEMIKYASNALLATMISFANEVGNLSAAIGDIDVVDVMEGVHTSQYLTPVAPDGTPVRAPITSFLEAGCGFGGSCLPKDTRALIADGRRRGESMRVLEAVIETNESQRGRLVELAERAVDGLDGKRVAVLGLAFKPDTDDVRESPAVPLVQTLVERGAAVSIHDPVVRKLPTDISNGGVSLTDDLESAIRHADVVVLVTAWPQYREIPQLMARLETPPPVVDGRRLLDKTSVPSYVGIGLG